MFQNTEAVVQRCYVEKVFLEIPQNSQENTCARVSFLIKLQFGLLFPSSPTFFYKYAKHNHLRCPITGEVSLET